MKIEFLDDISAGGKFTQVVSNQLVRLYDFNTIQATKLKENITEKILKTNQMLDLSSLDFIEPINCNLMFVISDKDEGLKTDDNFNFMCALTLSSYQEMVLLIEPFCEEGTDGYQWLYEIDTPIDLLFSPGGTW
ncbi:hypothetical protein L3C95_28235 [Chitinophaga filiformis]|uniref:hypothetical protein n=1 Tax=Chitinophaga filiformis TaxID=104663 RepID=UPI001F339F35|nr:hypothetical protein [Chitinophaga filiformis]MCF6406820.1 hypothetical protein [Chitinophaga filiformis]